MSFRPLRRYQRSSPVSRAQCVLSKPNPHFEDLLQMEASQNMVTVSPFPLLRIAWPPCLPSAPSPAPVSLCNTQKGHSQDRVHFLFRYCHCIPAANMRKRRGSHSSACGLSLLRRAGLGETEESLQPSPAFGDRPRVPHLRATSTTGSGEVRLMTCWDPRRWPRRDVLGCRLPSPGATALQHWPSSGEESGLTPHTYILCFASRPHFPPGLLTPPGASTFSFVNHEMRPVYERKGWDRRARGFAGENYFNVIASFSPWDPAVGRSSYALCGQCTSTAKYGLFLCSFEIEHRSRKRQRMSFLTVCSVLGSLGVVVSFHLEGS